MSTVKFTADGLVTFRVSDLLVEFDVDMYDDDLLMVGVEDALSLAVERWLRTRIAEENPITEKLTTVLLDGVSVTTVKDEDAQPIDW